MYKCKAIEVDIPYKFENKYMQMNKAMKLKLLEKYDNGEITLNLLKEHVIYSVRGPRKMLYSLRYIIESLHKEKK